MKNNWSTLIFSTGLLSCFGASLTGCEYTANNVTETGSAEELLTAQTAALNAHWGSNTQVSVDDDYVYIESDGYPNHEIQAAYYQNEDTIVEVNAVSGSYKLPILPQLAITATTTTGGPIGVLISGAVFYNPFEGDGVTYAVEGNKLINGYAFLDSCNGHPVPGSGQYHYHGTPYCITDVLDTESQHSVLIGYMLDGFPIYGPNGADGNTPNDLDNCNGHIEATAEFTTASYHYHTSAARPYVPNCFSGQVTLSGMPPGGMPPGGMPPSGM